MFIVSVPRIFKITMRVPCGETTGKVACEISALYNFAKTLSIGYVLKSSSRDFKKICFNQSCKLIAYKDTTKIELLTKSLREF